MIPLPLHHLICFGVTEFSGKTTMIESAITNAGYRGLTFRTKRGELGFENATKLPIYFDDKGLVTWSNLIGLMTAMFNDRIEREPGVKYAIQTVCKSPTQAQNLDEIYQRANKKHGEYKEGSFKEEVFGKLVNYLEEILPELKKVDYTNRLEMGEQGLYMMDLVGLSDPVKNLIIASTLRKIYTDMDNVISVIPDAKEYIPRRIGTPTKWIVNMILGKGRSVGNYVWIDTQNMKGVDTEPARNIDVRLFGRQPDAYEIRELLKALPMGEDAPSAKEMMTLNVGEFYAKLKNEFVKVYARPVWLPEEITISVAKGEVKADSDAVQAFKPNGPIEKYQSKLANQFIDAADRMTEGQEFAEIMRLPDPDIDWSDIDRKISEVEAMLG